MSLADKKKYPYNAEKRRKIKEIKNNELNKECFDCGSCYPEYISINNGVFICKDCLKIHNKFPKQISTTLKNNLSSLNLKEIEFMYLGGNQKLLEFINYEYPQLHKFKINILYQTKAMQYYRNNLYYLVNGGPKPVKPNEKINAYELVDINDYLVKNEKINMKSNNKTNKINTNSNNNMKEKKRNKSVGRINLSERNTDKREKNKTYKIKRDKRRNSLSHTDNDDNLKRHKSFYKEMNKLFGENYDIENPNKENNLDNNNDNNSVYSKQKITKENNRKKTESEGNNENNKFIPNTNDNNKNTNFKEYPIGNIYNNNYFTLSATKNIFMFTPNKDSIIYKHRKINTIGNPNNNPALKAVKEIYYKPKIPYLINTNRKKINNENLYFSLKEHYINDLEYNIDNENSNDLNQIKNNLKSLNTFYTYGKKDRKNNDENGLLEKEQYIKDDNDIVHNGGANIEKDNNNNNNETFNNTIPYKKKENKFNGDEDNININNYNEKKGNNIIYRNYKKSSDNNFSTNYNYERNKTELKDIKIDKIIKTISNNIHNEIDTNLEDVKNKTFFNKKDYKRKIFNKTNNSNKDKEEDKNIDNITINKTENGQKDPIRIEEGDEEIVNNTPNKEDINIKEEKNDNNKLFIDKRKNISIPLYRTKTCENERHNVIIKNINKENNEKNIEKEKNKDQVILKEKQNKENIESNEENESYFNKEKNKKAKEILSKGRYNLKRGYKKMTIDNSKDNQKKDFQNSNTFSVIENNIDLSKTQKESISNIEPKKFSIRNKYKMRKMNEMV